MRKRIQSGDFLAFVITLTILLTAPYFWGQAAGQNGRSSGGQGKVVPLRPTGVASGQFIAVFRGNIANPGASAQRLGAQHGLRVGHVYQHALKGFSFSGSAAAAEALARNPQIEFVEPDQFVRIFAQDIPTGIQRVGADTNGTANIDGVPNAVDVDVAVIDTGIDLDHPDLNVVGSINCARGFFSTVCKDGGDDGHGHGTHVAGTIGAKDNDFGVVGMAPGARLWAVRVLDNNGSGLVSWIIAGIDWVTARANIIEVANMSLGFEGQNAALDTAIANSVAAGITYVVAAGNNAADAATFSPANHPDVITVSAMADFNGGPGGGAPATCRSDVDDTFADFSNFGSVVEIAAPGVCINSTWKDGGYNVISGTSMASPHVAGAAALIKANNPSFSPAQVLQALLAAATPQADADGFSGDPDAFHEPLLFVGEGPSNDAPGVSISNPADGSTFNSGETVSFTGTAMDAEDGVITDSLSWSSDVDGPIGTGGSFSATLSDGFHTITASVTDSGGRTSTSSVRITVGNPPAVATTVSVESIDYGTAGGKSNDKDLYITVSHVDDLGNPVAGATNEILLVNQTTLQAWGGNGTTDAEGLVVYKLRNAPNGCYSSIVTNVVATGLDWDGLQPPPNTFCK